MTKHLERVGKQKMGQNKSSVWAVSSYPTIKINLYLNICDAESEMCDLSLSKKKLK